MDITILEMAIHYQNRYGHFLIYLILVAVIFRIIIQY